MSANPDAMPAPPSKTERDQLFEHSLDLLCIAGLDGYFREVNPSWTRVLGWSREELLAREIIEFVHPEDRESTLKGRRGMSDGVPVKGFENRYLCKDGSYRWLSWHSTIEPGSATVFAVARDVTERRLADHEQLVMGKLESAGVLAAGIAHDFNNLLGSLLLNLEMVSLSGPVSDRQRRHLQQAVRSVHSARSLTDQLITFAQGGASVSEVTDLREPIRQAVAGALSGGNVRGDCLLAEDLRPVEVDAGQIIQALQNLLLNAREALPEGGTVRVRAENRTLTSPPAAGYSSGDYVAIMVSDDGPGIAPDLLAKVFDPYFSTKQRGEQKGMGLGLTICRAVIQKHGGLVLIDSRPGEGSTFTCLLPASSRSLPLPVPVAETPAGTTARILVLEDDSNLRGIIAQALRHLGYEAVVKEDGREVLRVHEEAAGAGRPFALVLLDLTVRGGMGGSEVMSILRERDPAIRAILMSGYTQEPIFRDYARHGFFAALAKPFSAQALRSALAAALAEAAAPA